MTKNNHGFEPKQEITIGGIPFTIIQAEEKRFLETGVFDTEDST